VKKAGIVLGVVLATGILSGVLGFRRAPQPSARSVAENVRAGFRAHAQFEPVAAAELRSLRSRPGVRVETYAIDPSKDAYKLRQKLMGHPDRVSLVSGLHDSTTPFIVDLFFHGDLDGPDPLAVRIRDLDLRKFLPQSVASFTDDRDLARVQAYFSEFARAAKIIRRRPGETPYESEGLGRIREALSPLASTAGPDVATALDELSAELDRGLEARLDVVEAKITQWLERGALRGSAELSRVRDQVRILGIARRMERIVLINNCREPGNYELQLSDAIGRPLVRGGFSIPVRRYGELLGAYHGIDVAGQGTGVAVPTRARTPALATETRATGSRGCPGTGSRASRA
jgi:hypothetical protein